MFFRFEAVPLNILGVILIFVCFEIGQQIVGQYVIYFLIGHIFETNDFLGMVFILFLIHPPSSFK